MNDHRKFITISIFFVIALILITGCLYYDFIICKSYDIKNDIDFHYLSYTKIITKGNDSIDQIVADTKVSGNTNQRIYKIADLIIQDFTDPFWVHQKESFCTFYRSDGSNWSDWCMYFGNTSFSNITYRHDKNGKVRIQTTNDLSNDPRWIAYQKTGACQDSSILFNETVNRSGYISHVVRANGIGHFWIEIYLNGEWNTFDIQKYGSKSLNYLNWSGKRADYVNNSDFPDRCELVKCGVYVFDEKNYGYGEDITQFYDPDSQCIHGRFDSPDCK